jgi:hypothetical protein
VVLLVVLAACSGSDGSDGDTVTIGGQQVAKAPLVDAHAALCEAAAQPATARALFFDRSHEALHTVARGLEDVDRAQAGALLEAKQKAETDLSIFAPGLTAALLRLADVYRAGLGRLAITAPPCDK